MTGNRKILTELFRLGELPEGWEEKIDRETIDGEVGEILASDREILEKYRPSRMAARIKEKAAEEHDAGKKKTARKALTYVTAAAAMVALGMILPGMLADTTGLNPSELTRVKGSTETVLRVYRNTGFSTDVLSENSVAHEKDLIQLGYSVSPELPYGIIISIDGRGIVTRHLAPEGDLPEN